MTKLLEDLAVLQPTVFPSVPRLFNRIYDKLVQVQLRSWLGCCVPVVKATALIWAVWLSVQGVAVAGGLKKFLFDYALASKSYYLKDGFTQHKLWDKLVFGKVCSRCVAPTPPASRPLSHGAWASSCVQLRALLGGRVRVMITGSAPISSAVKDFLQVRACNRLPTASPRVTCVLPSAGGVLLPCVRGLRLDRDVRHGHCDARPSP